MDRTQRLLAWLLGIQIVLLAILHAPFGRHGAAASGPLLPALSSMTPQVLQIAGGDGATVTLERRAGGWSLSDPAGYPALGDKVDELMRSLKKLAPGRQVVSGSRYHAALKVADDAFERRVRLWDKPGGGRASLELYVGTSPGADYTHVRVGGNDRVYEAAGLSAFDLPDDAGSWVERRLVDWKSEDVGGVEITNHRGSFALEKRAGSWAVRAPAARAKAELDPSKVNDLVNALCGLSLDTPAAVLDEKAQGLAAPEATVVLDPAPAADSTSVIHRPRAKLTIRIGAPVPGKTDERYATRDGLAFAVTLAKWATDRPDTVALGDLVKKK